MLVKDVKEVYVTKSHEHPETSKPVARSKAHLRQKGLTAPLGSVMGVMANVSQDNCKDMEAKICKLVVSRA